MFSCCDKMRLGGGMIAFCLCPRRGGQHPRRETLWASRPTKRIGTTARWATAPYPDLFGTQGGHIRLRQRLGGLVPVRSSKEMCHSTKRTHRFGGRSFAYQPTFQVLMLFAEPVCRWVRFGKRTHRRGVFGGYSWKSGLVYGERCRLGESRWKRPSHVQAPKGIRGGRGRR